MRYYLSIKKSLESIDVKGILKSLGKFAYFNYVFNEDGSSRKDLNWDTCEEYMKELSELYSNVIFDLYVEDNCIEDCCHKYFKNGKMQVCKPSVIFPEYDENYLR